MATILITGNTELFTSEPLEQAAKHFRVVVAGKCASSVKDRNIRIYHTTPSEEKFSQLFDVYTFDAVWYISGYADGGMGSFGEMQFLERTLMECRRARVEKVILLSTWDSQNYLEQYGRSGEVIRREYSFSRAFSASQIEELGSFFGQKAGQKMIILWLPYLAGRENEKNFLGGVFQKLYDKEKILFPYHREDPIDFISYRDLITLLCQITEEIEDESASYFVGSGYRHTYDDFEKMLKIASPDGQMLYENYPNVIDQDTNFRELRKKYGFVPMDHVMVEIGSYYRAFVRNMMSPARGLVRKLTRHLQKAGAGLFRYLEILLFFVLAEFIAGYTSESVYFQFVDVRLFFIMIVATTYGMSLGIMAAIFECLVLVREFYTIGMQGVQLFYNIENWVPFAIYLMAGSITGYVKNKKTDEIKYLKEEYRLLRDKYIFLNDVYQGAIQNKSEYKRQILGFKDSFGKIFDAVQKLDSELPEKIFLEGLRTLEDILQNHSIAIYSLDSWQRFGRLMVCSSSLLSTLTKSIRLEDYRDLYETVKDGEIWRNTDLKEGYPMYAAGVFRDNTMVLLLTIQEAGTEQYGMDYINIFRIMCGLVQNSFLKALRYEELRETELYYPNTHIVYPERLRQLVAVQEDMRQAGVADYILLRFAEKNKEIVSGQLSGMIRATDTLGAAEDGTIYLILTQTNRQSFRYVESRLAGSGIRFQIVEKVS